MTRLQDTVPVLRQTGRLVLVNFVFVLGESVCCLQVCSLKVNTEYTFSDSTCEWTIKVKGGDHWPADR